MIDILVADDHEVFIEGLKTALMIAPDINIKNIAKNGCEVIKELKKSDYDVVLLDINMPKMNGVDCVKRIRKLPKDIKVLVLSQFGDKMLVDRLVKYNINGYLLKSSTKEEIAKAIREVYNNKKYFSEEIRSNNYYRNHFNSRYDFYKTEFSKREKQVLGYICEGKFNIEIAKELGISKNSVATFRQRIMVKAGMRNTAELVKWVVENDLID